MAAVACCHAPRKRRCAIPCTSDRLSRARWPAPPPPVRSQAALAALKTVAGSMRNHATNVGVHEGGSAAVLAVVRLGPDGVAAARQVGAVDLCWASLARFPGSVDLKLNARLALEGLLSSPEEKAAAKLAGMAAFSSAGSSPATSPTVSRVESVAPRPLGGAGQAHAKQ